MIKYIYQQDDWPDFTWDNDRLPQYIGQVRHLRGKLIGKMSSLGFSFKAEASLTTLTLDVIKSAEIEGEKLNYE
jgi:Fic family protein